MKKLIAILICVCLMLALMAGCGESKIEYYEEGEAPAAETAETAETVPALGYSAFAPDTVVGTVNGQNVTWMEYYYWLAYYAMYLQQLAAQNGMTLSGWDAYELSSENTNGTVALLNAQFAVTQYHVMDTKAQEMGLALDEEDMQIVLSVFEQNADAMGDADGVCSEEETAAFEAYLAEQCVDRAFFDYLSEVSLLNEKAYLELYGDNGGKYSDEDTLAYAENAGLMSAKHILLLTVDSATMEALSEEEIAEKKATAEDLSAQLQAVADDQEAMIALFDELEEEYNEDTGAAVYPDGYLFGEGQMVSAFEDAVKSLDENYGLSGVVESEYGYHIILRTPVNPDGLLTLDAYGNAVYLRNYAANAAFNGDMDTWMDAADVQWNEGFDALDMTAIFG